MYANDTERFELMTSNLYAAVISDSLDDMGIRNQVMKENLRPIEVSNNILVGRAKTLLAVDCYHVQDNPYDMEIRAIDSIKPGEVVIGCTNGSIRNGLWGELLSTASKMRGARGAIIDGLVRDSKKILELDFTVYCSGFKPVDSKGRGIVVDYDCPVEIGGVSVFPGDMIFADRDGIVVIPQKIVDEVIERALVKVTSESHTRRELLEGKLLREVYEKYGVL